MSFSINLPIKEIKIDNRIVNFVYFLISFLTILFISQIYRIILKSSDNLLLIRFTEDYVLIGLLFSLLLLRGKLIINNSAPFLLLFIYLSVNYMFVVSDFDLYRRFIILMLWYTIAINAVIFFKPKTFFYTISLMGIFSAATLLFNIEQTISDYVVNQNRLHAEGEGMDMNINNISLILVSLTAIATVIYKNISDIKFGGMLLFILYSCVLVVLLIGSTRSALLFYVLLVVYLLMGLPIRYMIIPFLLFLLSVIAAVIFSEELLIISRFTQYDYQTSGRLLAILDSLTNFANNPFFGIGEMRQETIQLQQIGDPDHNFFTRLLGSNGLIGFFFVVLFLIGLIIPKNKNKDIKGLAILQFFLFYSLMFSPTGAGILLAATAIFYISQMKNIDINSNIARTQ